VGFIGEEKKQLLQKDARKFWPNVSKEMSRYCFDQDGNIDANKVQVLRPFFEVDSFLNNHHSPVFLRVRMCFWSTQTRCDHN
jgi:hypothetical protein